MQREEKQRLLSLMQIEKAKVAEGYFRVAGIDEAGRGPLAGPVVAAACIIPANIFIAGINDSKRLTAKQRSCIYQTIRSSSCIQYAINEVSSEAIDSMGIVPATIEAMMKAVAKLLPPPDFLLIDGLNLPHSTISSQKEIRGDRRCYCIAAASIMAKVYRDHLMDQFHQQWPQYGFNQHKGYGTAQHLRALEEHGPCPIHRRSFAPLKVWTF